MSSSQASDLLSSKGLSHQLFTLPPKSLSVLSIERICADSLVEQPERHIFRDNIAGVAVLAVAPTNLVSRSNDAGPYRSCGSLRDRLELERPLAFCRCLLVDLLDHRLHVARVHVAGQLGLYASGMHGRCAYATFPMPLVESYGKKDVRCFRPAVSDKRLVRRPLKVRVLEIDVGETVT